MATLEVYLVTKYAINLFGEPFGDKRFILATASLERAQVEVSKAFSLAGDIGRSYKKILVQDVDE